MQRTLQSQTRPLVSDGRDREILDFILRSGVELSFQGIRRGMGIHQEALSRGLKRLQEQGLIVKRDNVYTPVGGMLKESSQWYVIIESVLPFDISVSDLSEAMAGKWFDGLRWFGASSDGSKLIWTTPDGLVKLRVQFVGNELIIETDAYGSERLSAAIRQAHTLFDHVAKLLVKTGGSSRYN
ncbi:MAG: helix-turn-helix domain-containing protein [Thermoprotei archaeon]